MCTARCKIPGWAWIVLLSASVGMSRVGVGGMSDPALGSLEDTKFGR